MTFESYFKTTPSGEWQSAGYADCPASEYLGFLKVRKDLALHHFELDENLITLWFANKIGIVTHRDELLFDTEAEADDFVGLLPEPTDSPEAS